MSPILETFRRWRWLGDGAETYPRCFEEVGDDVTTAIKGVEEIRFGDVSETVWVKIWCLRSK